MRRKSNWQLGQPAQAPDSLRPQVSGPGSSAPVLQSQQFFKRDLRFDARERRAETKMRPPSKGEMFVVRARDVQLIGIRETFRIAIARAEHREHRLLL